MNAIQTPFVGIARRRTIAASRGFSLIEILIALGVIAILAAMGIVGYGMYDEHTSKKTTGANLANAVALVKELEAKGALQKLEGPTGVSPTPIYPIRSMLNATTIGKLQYGQAGYNAAIAQGQRISTLIRTAAGPKLAALPESSLTPPPPGQQRNAAAPPVLADAWGNALVYVPSGGLSNVRINIKSGSPETVTITSTGVPTPTDLTITTQNRGFWASAGADGDLTTGNDNLYSFNR